MAYENKFEFYPYDVLLVRDAKDVMGQAAYISRLLKAALLRAEDKDNTVIGHSVTGDPGAEKHVFYRWNFQEAENIAFVERHFLDYAGQLLQAGRQRGLTALPDLFGPQLSYAIENKSLSRWTFNEITEILYPPPPRPSADILPFPRRVAGPRPA